jgi:hypothetical protein
VVESDALVRDRNARCDQLADRTDDVRRLHVTVRVIVPPYDKDTGVMPLAFQQEFMKKAKIVVVMRQEPPLRANGMAQVDGISGAA